MTTPVICIYHRDCADGMGAAWVVHNALYVFAGKEVEFYAANYNDDELPDVTGKEVFMVDFSYKRDTLLKLAADAYYITVIDHHDSAERELVNLPDNVVTVFDMEKSGAVLTWEFFFPGQPIPPLLEYVQDRDLWQWRLPKTAEVMSAVFSYPMTMESWYKMASCDIGELIDEGTALSRQRKKDVDQLVDTLTHWLEIAGHRVPAVNCPWMFASDVGHELCKLHSDAPFAATYTIVGDKARLSLRADRGSDSICAVVAEKFGGGGHPSAAGFQVSVTQLMDMIAEQPK